MYARLVLFKLGSGERDFAEKLFAQFAAAFRTKKGFVRATFLARESNGQYGGLIVWESKEDAEAAFEVLFPKLQETLKGRLKEPPVTDLYEVIEPAA